jgi:hypothetical protein
LDVCSEHARRLSSGAREQDQVVDMAVECELVRRILLPHNQLPLLKLPVFPKD